MSQLGSDQVGTTQLGEAAATGGGGGTTPTGPLTGEWTVDGTTVPEPIQWTRSPQTLELTTRVAADGTLRSSLSAIADVAGKVQTVVTADGGYQSFDQSTTGTAVSVSPPTGFEPHLVAGTHYLARYDERPADDGSLRYDVRLEFRRDVQRDPEDPADVLVQSAATDEWEFAFEHGTLAIQPSRVQDAAESGLPTTLGLTVTPAQAEVLLETLGTVAATTKRTVPGGDDFYVDTTAADRNTVAITPPSGAGDYLASGDYVVTGWSVQFQTPIRWRAGLEIAPA